MRRIRLAVTCLLTCLAAAVLPEAPAVAQIGTIPGANVGLPAGGVPTNPFASNYPSAPPPTIAPARESRRHPPRHRRRAQPRR